MLLSKLGASTHSIAKTQPDGLLCCGAKGLGGHLLAKTTPAAMQLEDGSGRTKDGRVGLIVHENRCPY